MSGARPVLPKPTHFKLNVARGILMAVVAFGFAPKLVGASSALDVPASIERYQLEISRTRLTDALRAFGEQTRLQIAHFSDVEPVNLVVGPLHGAYTREEALNLLLQGTGLTYRFVNDHTVAIVKDSASPGRSAESKTQSSELQPKSAAPDQSDSGSRDTNTKQIGEVNDTRGEQMNHGRLLQRLLSMFVLCSIATVRTNPACAQEVPDQNSGKLEEIVVTAQRRAENLQNVPISVQVIDSQSMKEQNQNSLDELSETVPAVHISNPGLFSNNLVIRGVGSGANNPSFDQSVAMFDDDIFHGRSRMSGATFLDLDRIEVLKGPQSTFFGNNAIAGALNIVTAKPGDTFDAWGRLLYGQYGTYAAEGAISGPITDTFSARLAVTRNGDYDGWIYNVDTDQHVPRVNNEAGRLTLDFHPNEALDASLKTEFGQNRTAGSPGDEPPQFANCPPPAPITAAFADFGACATTLSLGVPVGLDNNLKGGLPGTGSSLSTFEDVLTINYHALGQTFTSVTGFYDYHFNSQADWLLPVDSVATTIDPEKYHQFSQEFRIASPTGQPIEYLAGVYLQTDELDWAQVFNIPLFDPYGPLLGIPPQYLPMNVYTPLATDEHAYSIFGSLSWNATDRLKLSAGLRGSSVEKTFTETLDYGYATSLYSGYNPLPPALEPAWSIIYGPTGTVNHSRTDRSLMPSADLQYQIDPEAMAYVSYRKGFKAGGFNGDGPLNQSTGFNPEHVDAYEVGIKSKWLDNRLLLNLDVFRSDYTGLQVNASTYQPSTNSYLFKIANAASSVSEGVEFETKWVVIKDLQLSADVTYLESYYVRYSNAAVTGLQTFCAADNGAGTIAECNSLYPNPVSNTQNLSGKPTDYAPKWSGSVNAEYSLLFPGDYKFTAHLSPYFSSGQFLGGGTDDPLLYIGGYVRLDARLTLQKPDSRWAVDLIGKNLTDRVIPTYLAGVGPGMKEEPRNVAVQFRYRW